MARSLIDSHFFEDILEIVPRKASYKIEWFKKFLFILNKIQKELVYSKNYLIFTLLLNLYIFMPLFFSQPTIKSRLATVISMLVLFLFSKISKNIFILLSLLTLTITSLISHIAWHWGTDNLSARIEVAALSPRYESREYLMNFLDKSDLIILFYFIIGLYLIYKFVVGTKHYYKTVRVLSLFTISFLLALMVYTDQIKSLRPYVFIKQYINIDNLEKIRERKVYLKNIKDNTIVSTENLLYDKIVIIMGESVNKHHMSVYDYKLKTTPFLDQLVESRNGFAYNVIAPANQTRYAIPLDLTDATVGRFDDFYKSKSLVTTFKEYGYKTHWFSNQALVGAHENAVATIVNEADDINVANRVYKEIKRDRTVMMKYLDGIHTNNAKEVFFFHLIGSHIYYKKRYLEKDALIKNAKNLIEEYDNTIYSTDMLLKEIYKKFNKDPNVLFVYLSDHGEVVNISKNGHSFFPAYQDEYDIPLIIHSSKKNQRMVKLKELNQLSTFNMEGFNTLIKYITGMDANVSEISTSRTIFAVEPKNILDYKNIKRYK
jgi:glucan phosphoethanolaminetransferase (alkaline phosphatase superfamily)